MTPEFWKGKRVFLTGHTGFKGSWLSIWLQELGASVTGFALDAPDDPNTLFRIAEVGRGMTSVIGDIRDPQALTAAMKAAQPEIVIHMAAQPLVRRSYREPVETYATNVMGLVHLLDAARCIDSIRAIVNVTSDKAYDNQGSLWGYREIDPMGGHDPYSSSKGCAELVTAAYRSSYFNEGGRIALASARAGNVIGGGDWAEDRLVPDIFRAIAGGEAVCVRNPDATRPWQHVLEPLSGYLAVAERLYSDGAEFAEGWNFGPSDTDAKPVRWIVDRITRMWGSGARWTLDAVQGPHEAHYLKLDSSKARQRLGWAPAWTLETALQHTTDWYRASTEGGNSMRDLTIRQIAIHRADTGRQLGTEEQTTAPAEKAPRVAAVRT